MEKEYYTNEEICKLLEKALAMGLDMKANSELEHYTISELDRLVNRIQ